MTYVLLGSVLVLGLLSLWIGLRYQDVYYRQRVLVEVTLALWADLRALEDEHRHPVAGGRAREGARLARLRLGLAQQGRLLGMEGEP